MWDLRVPRVHHLLSSFLSFSSGFQPSPALLILRLLFFFPVFHFTLPTSAFHLVHPFTCLLALIHLMCWQSGGGGGGGGLPANHSWLLHSSFTSSVLHSSCVLLYLHLYVSANPPSPKHSDTRSAITWLLLHTHTNAPPHPPETFIPAYLGPSPDVKCLPGWWRWWGDNTRTRVAILHTEKLDSCKKLLMQNSWTTDLVFFFFLTLLFVWKNGS